MKGAYSLVLLTQTQMIGVRDPSGFRPLCLGKLNGSYVLASETCALDLVQAEFIRELEPGEIVIINGSSIKSLYVKAPENRSFCIFEFIYFARPDSTFFEKNVYQIRKAHGRRLAEESSVAADLVMPFPDSGTYAALGYAEASGLPFEMGMIRNHYVGRTFIQPTQSMRDFSVRVKLNPVRSFLKDKRVIIIEDSIVRGTQLKDNIQILYECGAREIHMRPACPCLIQPCEFLNFSTSRSTLDLAGRQMIKKIEGVEDKNLEEYAEAGSEKNLEMIDLIRQQLKLTSLKYQALGDLVEAIGLPKEKLCTHCWDGTSYF